MTLLWSWSIILYTYCSTRSNNIMRLRQLVLMVIVLYYRPVSAAQVQFLFSFSLSCAFRWDKHRLTSFLWCVFAAGTICPPVYRRVRGCFFASWWTPQAPVHAVCFSLSSYHVDLTFEVCSSKHLLHRFVTDLCHTFYNSSLQFNWCIYLFVLFGFVIVSPCPLNDVINWQKCSFFLVSVSCLKNRWR